MVHSLLVYCNTSLLMNTRILVNKPSKRKKKKPSINNTYNTYINEKKINRIKVFITNR